MHYHRRATFDVATSLFVKDNMVVTTFSNTEVTDVTVPTDGVTVARTIGLSTTYTGRSIYTVVPFTDE